MKTSRTFWIVTAFALALLTLGAIGSTLPAHAGDTPPPAVPSPIPTQPDTQPVPFFIGREAVEKEVPHTPIPQNPYMAFGSWSGYHSDAYNSDTVDGSGPLGKAPIVTSYFFPSLPVKDGDPRYTIGIADLMAWGMDGRMVAGLPQFDLAKNVSYWRLVLINTKTVEHRPTLEVLDYFDLPAGVNPGQKAVPAGSYGYLDGEDRNVTVNPDGTVWRVEHTADRFEDEADVEKYDLTAYLRSDEDSIETIQPDFSGRLWFVTELGVIGILDMEERNPEDQVLATVQLPEGELVENGVATDTDGGMYLVSSKAMYRFDYPLEPDENSVIAQTWREPYDSGPPLKVLSMGSGTSPTLMGTDYVTIADNAEPQIHVLVYRRAKAVSGSRLICSVPVFKPGNSMTENSLNATDRSIIVENTFGYKSFQSTENGKTTKPGLARIDIDENGSGCHTEWTSEEIVPTIVPRLALHNGLIYTYAKDKGPANTDAWYFTAIDFESGETVYKVLAGTGRKVTPSTGGGAEMPLFNSHLGIVIIGPDDVAYIPVLGGIVSIRDGS